VRGEKGEKEARELARGEKDIANSKSPLAPHVYESKTFRNLLSRLPHYSYCMRSLSASLSLAAFRVLEEKSNEGTSHFRTFGSLTNKRKDSQLLPNVTSEIIDLMTDY